MKKNVCAVIVAAGSSVRFKSDKLFYETDGKPVIFHSIKPFADNRDINRIVVVTDKARAGRVKALFPDCNKLFFTEGGKTRSESVINGLNALCDEKICGCLAEKECDIVAVHDGARPFLSQKLLETLINEAAEKSSAIPFVAATDTVYLRQNAECCCQENGAVSGNNAVICGESSTVKAFARESVMLIQTPQVFDYRMIKAAYKAFAENATEKVTDESGINSDGEKTVHQMKLNPSPFEKIKSGNKTIELRLFDEKRQKIREGDIITFTDTSDGEQITRIVKKLHIFDSFEELYRTLPLLKCGYTVDDVDKARPSDMGQYYSEEEQQKYGVVGIELSSFVEAGGTTSHNHNDAADGMERSGCVVNGNEALNRIAYCDEVADCITGNEPSGYVIGGNEALNRVASSNEVLNCVVDNGRPLNCVTDDSGVFFAAYKTLNFVEGDRNNIKITYPSDIPESRAKNFCLGENDTPNNGKSVCQSNAGVTAENSIDENNTDAYGESVTSVCGKSCIDNRGGNDGRNDELKEKLVEIPDIADCKELNFPSANAGTGCDVHRLVEGRRLVLGGIDIPYEKGLLGHSDADVLLHAIMDAILSASGERDIGVQFPDTDERYRGISSMLLLSQVRRIVEGKGKKIKSVSATIIAQKPKLAHIIPSIAENIAKSLDLPAQRVNINVTTTERLGMIGEGEGIGAAAVAIVTQEPSGMK